MQLDKRKVYNALKILIEPIEYYENKIGLDAQYKKECVP